MNDFYRGMYYSMLRYDTAAHSHSFGIKLFRVLAVIIRNTDQMDTFITKYKV
jgi:hypothetical protein